MIRCIERLSEVVGRCVSWVNPVLVLLITLNVVLRYFFDFSSAWMKELEWHFFSLLFLLGASYTLKHDEHVRVDIFYQRFGPRAKAFINLAGTLVFLLPGCYLVIWASYPFVEMAWKFKESSPDPGGLGMRYLLKSVLPLSFLLIIIQGFSLLVVNFRQLCGKGSKGSDD